MPNYAPNETAAELYTERTFLADDFINGLVFGILICLYFQCSTLLWAQRSRKLSVILMAYITVLFLILIMFVSVSAGTSQQMFIDDRAYPEGPVQYFLDTQSLPINVLWIVTFFLLTFFADSLIFWRCWIIWSVSHRRAAYIATAFPFLMLLASFVLGILWVLQSSQPGLSLYSKVPVAFGISYYTLSIGVNIILTFLITIRLLIYRRRFKATSTEAPVQVYTSLLTIFIESAALYSVFSICYLVTYAIGNSINNVFIGFTTGAQQISAFLIVYRLAAGTAWRIDTVEKELSTLKFNVTRQTATSSNYSTSALGTPNNFRTPGPAHSEIKSTNDLQIPESAHLNSIVVAEK